MSDCMYTLKLIGYWRDDSNRFIYPHPKELIFSEWDRKERELVAKYLESGCRFTGYGGFSCCRFQDGPSSLDMGCYELTDGVWVWPEGLPIYVRQYSVGLPTEFIQFVRDNDYKIQVSESHPLKLHLSVFELEDEDIDKRSVECYSTICWITWCNHNRKNRFLAMIAMIITWYGKMKKKYFEGIPRG